MSYLPERPGMWGEVLKPTSFSSESRQQKSLISSPMRNLPQSGQFSNSGNLLRPGGLRWTRSGADQDFAVNLNPGFSLGLRIYSLSFGKSRHRKSGFALISLLRQH